MGKLSCLLPMGCICVSYKGSRIALNRPRLDSSLWMEFYYIMGQNFRPRIPL